MIIMMIWYISDAFCDSVICNFKWGKVLSPPDVLVNFQSLFFQNELQGWLRFSSHDFPSPLMIGLTFKRKKGSKSSLTYLSEDWPLFHHSQHFNRVDIELKEKSSCDAPDGDVHISKGLWSPSMMISNNKRWSAHDWRVKSLLMHIPRKSFEDTQERGDGETGGKEMGWSSPEAVTFGKNRRTKFKKKNDHEHPNDCWNLISISSTSGSLSRSF